MQRKFYSLPPLPYGYGELSPYMSEQQLIVHHQKHHQAYVKNANSILEKLENARKDNADLEMKPILKDISFNLGGHVLHSLFWNNLTPKPTKPMGTLLQKLEEEFGDVEMFRKEFTQAAVSVEGSGWAALSLCKKSGRLIIMQIEKHNVNVCPDFPILLVLDVWEHAYYIDYRNDRAKFVEAFWNIVNWQEAGKRLERALANQEQ